MKIGMTASRLRIVLLILMVLVVIAAIAGFYYAQSQLRTVATTISELNADVNAGGQNVQTLNGLEKKLEEENDTAEKARAIVAESKEYVYQDSIVKDINQIAKNSGVVVTNFTFSETSTTPATGATATTPTTSTTPSTTAPTTTSVNGVNTRSVSVAIENPVTYVQVLNFIKQIEKNSLKMQISNVALSVDDKDPNSVSSETFTIKVYVR